MGQPEAAVAPPCARGRPVCLKTCGPVCGAAAPDRERPAAGRQ